MMKILAIDDQQLVLLPIEKRLTEMGYEVKIETDSKKGLVAFETFRPDLLIIDINMPGINGMQIIESIREKNKNTPIMVLSGNTNDDIILHGFELGVTDYMKKPLGLNEICARVKRSLGSPSNKSVSSSSANILIQHRCVGVVIPCYNEEERLLSKTFIDFVDANSGYHLCFVNDGSTDRTLEVLNELRKGREDYISVYDCVVNGGKAEAVRRGMLYLSNFQDLDFIGFLDADLSTDFKDFELLVQSIEHSDYKIVSGSRISRMGADITKESARAIISKTINLMIRTILSMDFKDTQCGAKIFRKDTVRQLFTVPFITRWLFDVEIFMRLRNDVGIKNARRQICERPLNRWIHADGSKLSFRDSLKIGIQLVRIAWSYSLSPLKSKYMEDHKGQIKLT